MKKIFITFFILVILSFVFIISNEDKKSKSLLSQDYPNRAAELDYEKMKDPQLGLIPFERFPIALTQTKLQFRNLQTETSLTWSAIISDMGGRTKTICFDPNDSSNEKVWAGAATGGLWYNNQISNPNSPWIPVSDVWQTLSISAICFDPLNTQEIYIGTGEHETAITDMYRESSGRGYGIWKSNDGGQSFTRLLSTQNFSYITDIVIKNENNQAVIYVGVVSGVYRGTSFETQPTEGLYRSYDGGQTWQQVLPNVQGTLYPYAPSDIEITGDGTILVGTKRNMYDEGGGVILFSNTGDPGSWTIVDSFKNDIENSSLFNIPGRVKLASAPSNPQKIYALIAAKSLQNTIEGFPQTIGKYLIVSENGGQTWQYRNIPSGNLIQNWAYLAWHAMSIVVDPNDENKIFAGGLDVHTSTDGGNSWQKVSDWALMYQGGGNEYVHADIHQIVFSPGNSSKLIIATDGGVFYTENADDNFIVFQKRNKSFSTLQYYTVAINKNGQELIAGGLQDNGTLLHIPGTVLTEYNMVQGGDGAFCFFDDDENLLITSTYDNQFAVTSYTTNTTNWLYDYVSGLFTSAFDYDSANNTIWAIASDLHNNRLNEVLKLNDILGVGNGSFINLNTNTDKYFSSIRLIDNDRMLIGTANGKLYRVNNINTTPTAIRIDNDNFVDGFISSIQTLDDGQRILVTLSNYGVISVWQTTDGGNTWTDVEANLPDMPVRWAIYHPANPNQVMLATETGVWTTDNINAPTVTWYPQNNGFPNVRVDMLDVNPNNYKVVAATHGRNLFTTIWNEVQSISAMEQAVEFKIYPNPSTDFVIVDYPEKIKTIKIFDLNAKLLKSFTDIDAKPKIDVSFLSKGTYFVMVNHSVKKLLVN